MVKDAKPKTLNPWDRRPWPGNGDASQDALYAAIGRALSEWERYEAVLSFLYSSFVTTTEFRAARRSYSAVRTFEGRLGMLKAASEAHFSAHPDALLVDVWKSALKKSAKYCERRNEIAHGAVDHYQPEPPAVPPIPAINTFALFPSYATFKTRDLEGTPSYCYTTPELEYFRLEFFKLRRPAVELSNDLIKVGAQRTSLERFRSLYRGPASRAAEDSS